MAWVGLTEMAGILKIPPSTLSGAAKTGRVPSKRDKKTDPPKLMFNVEAVKRAWEISEPLADTPAGRLLFRLVPLKPRMNGKEFGFWHTPRASEHGEGSETFVTRNGDRTENCFSGLTAQARAVEAGLWPTPTNRDYRTGYGDTEAGRARMKHSRGKPLTDVVSMFPTPTTGAGLCGGTGHYQELQRLKDAEIITEEERRNMSQGNGGQLNPTWLEWLMGFPIGWTELEPSETP